MITWADIEGFEAALAQEDAKLRDRYNSDPEIKKLVDAMYVPDCYPTLEWCIAVAINDLYAT